LKGHATRYQLRSGKQYLLAYPAKHVTKGVREEADPLRAVRTRNMRPTARAANMTAALLTPNAPNNAIAVSKLLMAVNALQHFNTIFAGN